NVAGSPERSSPVRLRRERTVCARGQTDSARERRAVDGDHRLHERRLRALSPGGRVSIAKGRAVRREERRSRSRGAPGADGDRAHVASGAADRRQATDRIQSRSDRRCPRRARLSEGGTRSVPSQANLDKMWAYAKKYAEKSGTSLHPDRSVTE